jgi:hypothetical protein
MGNHVTAGVKTEEGEVAAGLDSANLVSLATEEEVLHRCLGIVLLARPFKSLGPGLVAQPVADVVGITL